MTQRISLYCLALCLAGLFTLAACDSANLDATAPGTDRVPGANVHVTPVHLPGNPTCSSQIPGSTEIKIESGFVGTHGPVTITSALPLNFTSEIPILGVVMKGGPNANFYNYQPGGTLGDTGLLTPTNPSNGRPYGLSHVSFCYIPQLSVSKTAVTTFDRDWDWTINKSNDSGTSSENPHEFYQGDSFWVTYTVSGGATSTDINHAVSGDIVISNPIYNAAPAIISGVSDVITPGDIAATVNCPVTFPHTLAAGQTLTCTYSADLPDGAQRLNTATVSVTQASAVKGGSATADVIFGSDPVNEYDTCIDLSDTLADIPAGYEQICIGDLVNGEYEFDYSHNVLSGLSLQCDETKKIRNVVSFLTNTQDGEPDDSGSAYSDVWVKRVCAPPGNQGCTPGYWRQEHHYDSWVGYAPLQLFNTVFGVDALPGVTLGQAVQLGGGGLNALARHAVAALLNASNPSVNYPYTTAQVIAMVQGAIASGDYEATKNLLAAANESSCPLN